MWGHAAANSRCPATTTHTHTHIHAVRKNARTNPQREQFEQTEKRSAAGFQIKGHRCLLKPRLVILFHNLSFSCQLYSVEFCSIWYCFSHEWGLEEFSFEAALFVCMDPWPRPNLLNAFWSNKPSIKPKNGIYFKAMSDSKHVKYILLIKKKYESKNHLDSFIPFKKSMYS